MTMAQRFKPDETKTSVCQMQKSCLTQAGPPSLPGPSAEFLDLFSALKFRDRSPIQLPGAWALLITEITLGNYSSFTTFSELEYCARPWGYPSEHRHIKFPALMVLTFQWGDPGQKTEYISLLLIIVQ